MRSFQKLEVAEVSAGSPARMRRKLLGLGALSFASAEATQGAGKIEEAQRWGEEYAMRLRRQIDLVENSGEWFPDELEFEGNRAIVRDESDEPPRPTLAVYVAASLTFHRNKQRPRPTRRGRESERARQCRKRSTKWGE